ncbi:MAG: hypothetical protein DMC60_03460 [Verrucomicrobia bacterium]|nr:MAG: hypothetical protein DMC60_03460 [Verrucomicrobiota bacterium]
MRPRRSSKSSIPEKPGNTFSPVKRSRCRTFCHLKWKSSLREKSLRIRRSPRANLNKPGIGIHGTNNPETIGRAASHGCIRLANWDAARVKDLVSVGNTVIIF